MASIEQICNRLREWVPIEMLSLAECLFYDMVDKGIQPEQALKVTVQLCHEQMR